MRGEERQQRSMLMVLNLEQRVAKEHPLRRIKQLAETVLQGLSASFDRMYSATGRPSIPPERLLKASLLMALYTVRSERLLCEQLDYNLLFRWFLDLELDEASFDHSSFSANRKRLLEHEVAGEFFRGVVAQARALKLLSGEHFTVDGTLIEAWASLKSFQRKGAEASNRSDDDPGNPTVNFHGERAELSGARRRRWPTSGWRAVAALLWLGTRATIRTASSRRAAHSRSPRTWPRITRGRGVPRSTRAPPGIRVMRSVNGCANGSRRASAG